MRELATADRIRRFMRAAGAEAVADGAAYFIGGATAVLLGWRDTTIDIDVSFVPEDDAVLRALPRIKNELRVNVELVGPADFVPAPAGWEERSLPVTREGTLSYYHLDPYSQVLAKLERAHAQDLEDVSAMLTAGLVDPDRLRAFFDEIEPQLYRYPAVDPAAFRSRVEQAVAA